MGDTASLSQARGGEIFVRKAPACTALALAQTMVRKYSQHPESHEIRSVGIRPGEKIHEILVNEYELTRSEKSDEFYVIHPEYRLPDRLPARALGEEYTSANTRQLTDSQDIERLLDAMGQVEYFL